MLADWQSFNDIYGTTNNPWDVTRAPGGSSGGSAVALACGMSALEVGSDIGASIRNPAHYCGVYGHKPTYGIVPMRGQFLPGIVSPSDISVAGPLALSRRGVRVVRLVGVGLARARLGAVVLAELSGHCVSAPRHPDVCRGALCRVRSMEVVRPPVASAVLAVLAQGEVRHRCEA